MAAGWRPANCAGPDVNATPQWAARPERGSARLLRVMAALALHTRRGLARAVLWPISLYFWLATPRARADSKRYLERLRQRPARWHETLTHYQVFSTVILDRVYLLGGRTDRLDVRLHGEALLQQAVREGRGAFLVGAHLGSFEALRALGRRQPGLRVAMAMYEDNARRIGEFLRTLDPALELDIVPLGRVDSMLMIQQRLDRGDFVGFLADRWFGTDHTVDIPFLGHVAPFPTGVYRMAAVMRRPVLMMAGLYGGGNRYDVRIDALADFTDVERGDRAAAIDAAARGFAARLEAHCRAAPYNWFNFYDFWQPHANDAPLPQQRPT